MVKKCIEIFSGNKYYFPLLVLLACLPVIILRDFTPSNELRYLSIADEALRSGHFFTFMNHGIPYADKPPLYFWIIMLGKILLGKHSMWFLSLFSFIPAFVIIQVMNKWVSPIMSAQDRLLSGAMLMTSGLFLALALVLRMDMLMCMFIVLSLYTFYKILKNRATTFDTYLFPIYIFMAVFSKGPIGIIIPLLSTTVFLVLKKQRMKWVKFWGWKTWGILLTLFAVWLLFVYLEGGGEYFNDLVFHQTFGRAIDSFHHKHAFYYYFITYWYSLAPWSIFIVVVMSLTLVRKKMRTDLKLFFFVVILVTLFTLSLISSKLEVYLAPAFPFFVYLTVLFMRKLEVTKYLKWSLAFPALLLSLSLLILAYSVFFLKMEYLNSLFIWIAAVVLSVFSALGSYLLLKRKALQESILAISVGLLLAVFIAAWALPSLNGRLGYAYVCKVALKLSKEKSITKFNALSVRHAANMDVFLNTDVGEVTRTQVLENKLSESILILKNSALKPADSLSISLQNRERYVVEPYSLFVISDK